MVDFRIDVIVNTRGVNRGTREVERRLGAVQTRADALRASLARTFAILGGGAAIAGAVRTIANFDRAIQTAGTIARATGADFQRLSERARELGATTRFTATDAANGLTELARAGFTVDESLTAVGDALTLAQVGSISLQDAANATARAVRTFGLQASDAADVADVISVAANSSTQTVGDLTQAFRFAGPAAASAGLSIRDTAAALSVLADQGLAGTLGGTGLRQVLVALLSPTDEAADKLRELGLSVEDVNPATVGLSTALNRLAEAGLDAANGAFDVFPARAGSAFLALTANAGAIDAARARLDDIGGSAQRTATQLDNNLEGALRRVASAFEAVILSVGEAGATGGLRSAVESLAVGLRFLAANGETVLNTFNTLAVFITQVFVARAIRGAIAGLRALATAALANPFTALATVLAGIVSILVGFRNEIQASTDGVANLGDVFAVTFEAIQQVAVPILEGLLSIFNEVFGTGFQISIRGFVEAAAFGFDRFLGIVRGTVFAVRSLFSVLFLEVLGELAIEGVNLILAGFESLLDSVRAVFNTIVSLTRQLLSALLTFARSAGEAINQALSGNVEAAAQFTRDANTAFNAAVSNFSADKVVSQFRTELRALSQDRTIDEIENQFSGAGERLGESLSNAFQAGFQEESIFGFVKSIFDEAEQRAREREERIRAAAARAGAAGGGGGASIPVPTPPGEGGGGGGNGQQNFTAGSFEQLDAAITNLDKRRDFGAGISRGLLRLQQEAMDLASVGEAVANVFADTATNAIIEFVETGEFNFREFANSILQELLRIIVRLLVVQALNAAVGGAGGAVTQGIAAGAGAGARQTGGAVQRDRSFIVGERGPELFTPGASGFITPNRELMGKQQPQEPTVVNVINVNNPDEIPEGINSGNADQAIVNVLARNRDQVRQITQ